MAQFCTKCGAPLKEGMSFCTGCGATLGALSAPAAEAPAAPTPPAPVAPAPVMPPVQSVVSPVAQPPVAAASSGSPVVKIILIVVAVVIFLGLLTIGSCVYFVYRAKQRVNQFEKQVHATFPTATGTREVQPQPAAPAAAPSPETAPAIDMAALAYPGATIKEGGAEVSAGGGAVKIQQSNTSDSVDKVLAFYKGKLGPKALVTQSGNSAVVEYVGSNGAVTTISITTDSDSGTTNITTNIVAGRE